MYLFTINKLELKCKDERELRKKIAIYCGGNSSIHKKLYKDALKAKETAEKKQLKKESKTLKT